MRWSSVVEWHSPSLKCSTTCRYEKSKSAPRKKIWSVYMVGLETRCVSSPQEQGALRSCLTTSWQKLDCRMCLSALRKLPRTAEWCGLTAAVLFCPNQQLNKCLSFFPNNFADWQLFVWWRGIKNCQGPDGQGREERCEDYSACWLHHCGQIRWACTDWGSHGGFGHSCWLDGRFRWARENNREHWGGKGMPSRNKKSNWDPLLLFLKAA